MYASYNRVKFGFTAIQYRNLLLLDISDVIIIMNNIFLNGVKNKMSIVTKICMDCGKQFISESEESAVICEDCIALLKRRFWSSIKIGKAYDKANIT